MHRVLLLIALLACARAPSPPKACTAQPTAEGLRRAGTPGASALLPSGRHLAPLGETLGVGQSPQALAVSADGRLAALAEFGVNFRGLSIAALETPLRLAAQPVQSRSGGYRAVKFAPDGRLWALDTGEKRIEAWKADFASHDDIALQGDWPADFALSQDGRALWVAAALSNRVELYDARTGDLLATAQSGGVFPQALLLDEAASVLYVANQGALAGKKNRVNAFDAKTLALTGSWEVGKNPAALALSPDGRILYVAASDDDWIDRIDLDKRAALTPIPLFQPGTEDAPHPGLAVSPNALAVAGSRLFVSAAQLDAVLVVDAAQSAQVGAIPAGFRPTALAVAGGALLIANSKGNGTLPGLPLGAGTWAPDNSDVSRGTLQRVSPVPEAAALAAATASVAELNRQQDYPKPDPACATIGPLPAHRGAGAELSKIKHVIYVLKENKTFDSVFGDFPGAEASRDALEWGEPITPNQHELARQFCLLDNFYVESEQSVEGHFWATAQVTTDYFERNWAAPWGGHVIAPLPLPPGGLTPLDSPRNGFVFDQLSRQRIGYTSYGEFVGASGDLAKHIDFAFVDNPVNFLVRPDTEKLPVFLGALAAGKLQPFTFVALQYDHTFGYEPGKPDPTYMIADNDRATGLLVDAVSHSPYWGDTLILVTEDDPSGATDHVDLHRSFALVISPWARRERVSHVRASFPSLAATAERALGLGPLSALDAQAEPLWDCLADAPDARAFTALPSNVPPRTNPARPGWRARDFSGVDRARLGVELWRGARPGEPVPRRLLEEEEDDAD